MSVMQDEYNVARDIYQTYQICKAEFQFKS